MAYILDLKTFNDPRGSLSVFEDYEIPFTIKRIFFIYNLDKSDRAKHRHKKTFQALICFFGSCSVYTNNGKMKQVFNLDSPDKCLILNPEDWHIVSNVSKDTIILVAASEYFDPDDYIFSDY